MTHITCIMTHKEGGMMRKPRHHVRRTELLPKKMYALQCTPVQKQHRSAENARARTTSVSMSNAYRQSSVVLKQGENKFFREVTGGLGRGIWTGFCAYDAILWFLHKFNVDLKYLVDALREFKAVARLMCHCSVFSTQHLSASVH